MAADRILDRAYGKPPQLNTTDAEQFRRACDMTDDELARIACRSVFVEIYEFAMDRVGRPMPSQPCDHCACAISLHRVDGYAMRGRSGASVASIKDSVRVTVEALDAMAVQRGRRRCGSGME